ncbi:MAG: alpha/beta hydrolase family protein [Verrucomicrobiota bacterium]
MHPLLTRSIDRVIIRLATSAIPSAQRHEAHAAEAAALLDHLDFFSNEAQAPADFFLTQQNEFEFLSSIATPWENNNRVRGKLFPCAGDWEKFPTVILLHGWNDELGYRFRFPYVATLLRRHRINAVAMELPYHLRRRPTSANAISDFISADLWRMVEATRQSIADARSLEKWLRARGSPQIGLWGSSLGAWLGGLILCHDPEINVAVLTTPIAKLDCAINDLPFCAPIRASFEGTNLSLAKLNLSSHRPKAPLHRVLIQESVDDLFASKEAIEEVWRAWGQPEIWRLRHGHISVLMSVPVMKRTVNWIAQKFGETSKSRS